MKSYSKRINFLQIPIDSITLSETIEVVKDAIAHKKKLHHVVVNAGKVVSMQKDKELYNSVVSGDIINADGQSIVWGARWLGKYLPERVTGIDLMQELVKVSAIHQYKCFFLGAEETTVQKVVSIYSAEYGSDIIAGFKNGFFKESEEALIAKEIEESGAQILFVAMNSPKKENFIFRNKSFLNNVNFIMGVGGSFDVIAGVTKRAPVLMQRLGLEWFYRFIQEPKRMWKRYLIGNFHFVYLVIKEKFKTT